MRPGWGSFLFNLLFVVIPAMGALWSVIDATGGSGTDGSLFEPMAAAALFSMMALALGRMIFRDLRRLTAELEAEVRAAIKP